MVIGGAEFTIGVSKETTDPDDFSLALKIVVFGMDTMETTEMVGHELTKALLKLDPELEIKEHEYDKSDLH